MPPELLCRAAHDQQTAMRQFHRKALFWVVNPLELKGSHRAETDLCNDRIEFWFAGAARLHDRFSYERDERGAWTETRLNP